MIEQRIAGVVKWFSTVRGYGFITAEDGNDYFVHFTGIAYEGANQKRMLEEGERVTFRVTTTMKGTEARAVKREALTDVYPSDVSSGSVRCPKCFAQFTGLKPGITEVRCACGQNFMARA